MLLYCIVLHYGACELDSTICAALPVSRELGLGKSFRKLILWWVVDCVIRNS